jgi:hypothetical protein
MRGKMKQMTPWLWCHSRGHHVAMFASSSRAVAIVMHTDEHVRNRPDTYDAEEIPDPPPDPISDSDILAAVSWADEARIDVVQLADSEWGASGTKQWYDSTGATFTEALVTAWRKHGSPT